MNSIQKLCRICLTQDEVEKMESIFENGCKTALEIFLITQLKIIEINKAMPALICRQCKNELLIAMNFRKKCQSSDAFYREKISNFEQKSLRIIFEENIEEAKDGEIYLFESMDNLDLDHLKITKDCNNLAEIKDHELTQCKLCFKKFTSVHSLKDHMRAIHQKLEEDDMYQCEFCNKLFKMKYYLNRHIKSYHTKQVQKRVTTKKEKIASDAKEVFDTKLTGLKCPYCSKYLTSKHSLNDHIKVKHEFINVSDRFLCDV